MHLRERASHLLAQFRRKADTLAPPRFSVEKGAFRNLAAEHFFQTHRLPAKLRRIAVILLGLAALVLDRVSKPLALTAWQRNARFITAKLQHIALTGHAEPPRKDPHTADGHKIAPLFVQRLVVRSFVQNCAVRRPEILLPLRFHMDQRPLAAAEQEML